jgi:GNAT superfamily N-acetyltransferase
VSNWFRTADIKQVPKVELPKGYAVRFAKIGNGLCEKDRQGWIHLQEVRGYSQEALEQALTKLKPQSREWITTQWFKTPPTAEGVVFAEFNGEIVGCVCAIATLVDAVEFHHAMVLPEHRRKGLYKAMMALCLQYAKDGKFEQIYLAPNKVLRNYWNRVFGRR